MTLGSRFVWKRVKKKKKILRVNDGFQYIPLLDCLKVSLSVHSLVYKGRYSCLEGGGGGGLY